MSYSQQHDAACTKCAFFDDHIASAQSGSEGLCRFNPPVSQPSGNVHGLWPIVGAKDWCGHFSADSATAGTAD